MNKFIPYGCQCIDESDIKAVVDVLKSDWITTGPTINAFEQAITEFCGAQYGVAVSSGTAALHTAMYGIGIGPDDEVIVPPLTFAATANAVIFQGGTPVFCDVEADTLLINPNEVMKKISSKTKAIIAVDYAGQPCDYDALREIADKNNLTLVADACHSIGAEYKGRQVGTLAELSVFSFHPVKHITTGEGGMVVTNNSECAERMRMFRNHGITMDHKQRTEKGSWFYEIVDLGYNYRITDIQCALGISQLEKLPLWLKRRREIASQYTSAFKHLPQIIPLALKNGISHSYHLYVVKVVERDRGEVFNCLRNSGIGVNVHYIPVHMHPFYRERFGIKLGACPVAEQAYEQILTLPIFPSMSNDDIDRVISTIKECVS